MRRWHPTRATNKENLIKGQKSRILQHLKQKKNMGIFLCKLISFHLSPVVPCHANSKILICNAATTVKVYNIVPTYSKWEIFIPSLSKVRNKWIMCYLVLRPLVLSSNSIHAIFASLNVTAMESRLFSVPSDNTAIDSILPWSLNAVQRMISPPRCTKSISEIYS
jgi:hypothetical protein